MSTQEKDSYLPPTAFYLYSTIVHLQRQELTKLMDAKPHWLIVVTQQTSNIAMHLQALHQERCGDSMTIYPIQALPTTPVFCAFPRDQMTADELLAIVCVDELQTETISPEVLESQDYIVTTTPDTPYLMHMMDHWVAVDHLMS